MVKRGRWAVLLLSGLWFLFLPGCKKKAGPAAPAPLPLQVVTVAPEEVPVYFEAVGQTLGAADVEIRARIGGILEGIYFQEGSEVKQGTLLYSIDPGDLEEKVAGAKAGVAQAQTTLLKAKEDLDRYRPLAAMNAVSKLDLDHAQAQYDVAKSQVEAAQSELKAAQINLSYSKIYAPISGVIGVSQAKVGNFVGSPPNPVVLNTVSQLNPIHVRFTITETDYLELMKKLHGGKKKDPADRVPLEMILADGSSHPYPGHFRFADRKVDPSTGSLLIEAEFPNPQKIIRPGQYAKVRAAVDRRQGALLVPQRAVQELQGIYQVYLLGSDGKAQLRQVQAGLRQGDRWIIEEGLKAGDQVICEGLQKLKPGQPVVAKLTPPAAPTVAGQ